MKVCHKRIIMAATAMFIAQLAKAEEQAAIQPAQVSPGAKCMLDAEASKHPQWVKAVTCFNNGLTAVESEDLPSAREIIFRYEDKFMSSAIDADHKRINGPEFMAVFRQGLQEMTSALKANVQVMEEKLEASKKAEADQQASADAQRNAQLAAQAQARADADQRARRATANAFLLNMMRPQPAIPVYQMPTNQGTNCTTSYIGNQAYTHCQ